MNYITCAMDPKDFPVVFAKYEHLRQDLNYWGNCWIFVEITEPQQKRILAGGFMCKRIDA